RYRSALPSPLATTTEGPLEKRSWLWRGLQVGAPVLGEPVPLHRPPHLEGRHRPLQRGAGQLLEAAEAVPHRVLVHVESLGSGLDGQAVLDEGGHRLE